MALAGILGGLGGAGLGAAGGGALGMGLGKKVTDDDRKQKLIAIVGSLLGGSLGGVAGHKLLTSASNRNNESMLDAEIDERESRGIGIPQSALADLSPKERKYVLGRLSKRGSAMDSSVAYELGGLLAGHAHGGLTKSAEGNCPGSKIRSKGKGRGRGIGRALAMKYGWKDKSKSASAEPIEVTVERIKKSLDLGSEKQAGGWVQPAINTALVAAQFAPTIYDWVKGKKAAAPGAPGAPASTYAAGNYNTRPTSERTVAQSPYQFGDRGAAGQTVSASVGERLVKAALVKLAAPLPPGVDPITDDMILPPAAKFGKRLQSPAKGAVGELAGKLKRGVQVAKTIPGAIGGAAGALNQKIDTLGAGAKQVAQRAASNPTVQSLAGSAGLNIGPAAAPQVAAATGGRINRGAVAQKARRAPTRNALAANMPRAPQAPAAAGAPKSFWQRPVSSLWTGPKKPWTFGRVGKYGGIAALLAGLGAGGYYGGKKLGLWGQDAKKKDESIWDKEEMKQFGRLNIDPRALQASMRAAGTLQASGALRRAQLRNWQNAARSMLLGGGGGI